MAAGSYRIRRKRERRRGGRREEYLAQAVLVGNQQPLGNRIPSDSHQTREGGVGGKDIVGADSRIVVRVGDDDNVPGGIHHPDRLPPGEEQISRLVNHDVSCTRSGTDYDDTGNHARSQIYPSNAAVSRIGNVDPAIVEGKTLRIRQVGANRRTAIA